MSLGPLQNVRVRHRTGGILKGWLSGPATRERIFDLTTQVTKIIGEIKACEDPVERARAYFELYEQALEYDKEHDEWIQKNRPPGSGLRSQVSCKKGCSNCCHVRVATSPDEAALLYERAVDLGLDFSYIERQASRAVKDEFEWYRAQKGETACPFLDLETKACRVYDDRPLLCRDLLVVSDPKNCDISNGTKEVAWLVQIFSALTIDLIGNELKPKDVNADMATAILRAKYRAKKNIKTIESEH